MKSSPTMQIPELDPIDSILSAMDENRSLELTLKVRANENDKLEIAAYSSFKFADRTDLANLLCDIALSMLRDGWDKLHEMLIDCRSCAGHIQKYDVLPAVCSDCGRGRDEYTKKAAGTNPNG